MSSPSINFDSVCLSGNTQRKERNTTSKCLIFFDIFFCTWKEWKKKRLGPWAKGGKDAVLLRCGWADEGATAVGGRAIAKSSQRNYFRTLLETFVVLYGIPSAQGGQTPKKKKKSSKQLFTKKKKKETAPSCGVVSAKERLVEHIHYFSTASQRFFPTWTKKSPAELPSYFI